MLELASLDLSKTQATGKGVASLAGLAKLESLNLWQAKGIDDTAASNLVSLRTLKTLDVSETAIGDPGLEQLRALQGLRRLYLAGSRVTEAGVQAFIRSRPDCKVFWK